MSEANLTKLFIDNFTKSKIQNKLPKLFRIAEIESSRANKIGMEVGSLREKIIGGLLIHKFGEENVDTDIPTTEPEIDVKVNGKGVSIKTITGNGGVKAVWTVDAKSSRKFIKNYNPKCDIILVQVWWSKNKDSFFLIPIKVQKEIFNLLGRKKYLKMPKAGTNPRGVEFSKEAIKQMIEHEETLKISINWVKDDIKYDVYKRWVDRWND
ncbi:ThaI family type II restriction endonuclease [Candidatus Woesearchaeota archaeon]|nr:ThaI family type II restriction endonuclease [Candidatus Aenigmarchaeota archaeon]MBI2646998.1 ThaI family type II restriction endonuclease [Candidatus Woesearchaeota archaeon]